MLEWLKSIFSMRNNSSRQSVTEPKKKEQIHPPKTEQLQDVRCPHCGFLIDPPPQRSRKCPQCKEKFYVRTTPSGHKVLLDEAGKEHFDEERKRTAERNALLRQLGMLGVSESEFEARKRTRPGYSDSDILWGLFNERATEYAAAGQWGLYRNVRLGMGRLLMSEKRTKGALELMMEVTILDLNGADNSGRFLPKEFGFTAPGVLNYMTHMRDEEGLSSQEFKEMFLAKAGELKKNLRLPLSPTETWRRLEKDLKEAESIKNQ